MDAIAELIVRIESLEDALRKRVANADLQFRVLVRHERENAALRDRVRHLEAWLTDSTDLLDDPESVAFQLHRDPAFHDPVFVEQDETSPE